MIDGHGGIWQTPFLLFIASLVFQHVQDSKQGQGGAASVAPSEGRRTVGRSRDIREIHRPDQTSSAVMARQAQLRALLRSAFLGEIHPDRPDPAFSAARCPLALARGAKSQLFKAADANYLLSLIAPGSPHIVIPRPSIT